MSRRCQCQPRNAGKASGQFTRTTSGRRLRINALLITQSWHAPGNWLDRRREALKGGVWCLTGRAMAVPGIPLSSSRDVACSNFLSTPSFKVCSRRLSSTFPPDVAIAFPACSVGWPRAQSQRPNVCFSRSIVTRIGRYAYQAAQTRLHARSDPTQTCPTGFCPWVNIPGGWSFQACRLLICVAFGGLAKS